MRRKRLLWQIYPTYLLVIVLCIAGAVWYSSRTFHDFYLRQLESELGARARLVESRLHGRMTGEGIDWVDSLCDELGRRSATRITVILADGEVIGDSEKDPSGMENHANRPEIMEAMKGEAGSAVRYSRTLEKGMMYVAVPVEEQGRIVGTVRTSLSTRAIDMVLRRVYQRTALGGVVVALIAAAAGLALSRRFSRPIEEIKRGTERLARGDLGYRLPAYASEETGSLADAVNAMAAELQERMRTIVSQGKRQEAILSSMAEGVIAVDTDGRLIAVNRAAADLLAIDASKIVGRSIGDVVRRPELQRFIEKALGSRDIVEDDILVLADTERNLRVRGAPLTNEEGDSIGAVVVLDDMTKIHRLETMRRDFVANVSHELKTPITAVKGFVETLRGGAVANPEEAERFLGIIGTQANRLDAIVEDLLELSQIEKESESSEIVLEDSRLCGVVSSAAQACEPKAAGKGVSIRIVCDDAVRAQVNPALLERAVINLLDNAITYSDPGGAVSVEVEETASGIALRVCDAGCGIAPEHLPRLFERFYRVDKARSRKLGGTGLGLAIVKHIAQDHDGSVTVESVPGEGSTFTIHLPGPSGAVR